MNKKASRIVGLVTIGVLLAACNHQVRSEWETKDNKFCYEIEKEHGPVYVKCFDTDKYNVGDLLEDSDKT